MDHRTISTASLLAFRVGKYQLGVHSLCLPETPQVLLLVCSITTKISHQCAIGFSGVIFGLIVVDNGMTGAAQRSIFGFFYVPAQLYPWTLLVLWQVIMPGVSFLGHLCGVLVCLYPALALPLPLPCAPALPCASALPLWCTGVPLPCPCLPLPLPCAPALPCPVPLPCLCGVLVCLYPALACPCPVPLPCPALCLCPAFVVYWCASTLPLPCPCCCPVPLPCPALPCL